MKIQFKMERQSNGKSLRFNVKHISGDKQKCYVTKSMASNFIAIHQRKTHRRTQTRQPSIDVGPKIEFLDHFASSSCTSSLSSPINTHTKWKLTSRCFLLFESTMEKCWIVTFSRVEMNQYCFGRFTAVGGWWAIVSTQDTGFLWHSSGRNCN